MNANKDSLSSPCVRNCCLDEDDICLGCFRSLEEIKLWTQVDEQTRQRFLSNTEQRREKYCLQNDRAFIIEQDHKTSS